MTSDIPLTINLLDYTLLSFDVYGTLIDWETGIYTHLTPLLSHLPQPPPKAQIIPLFHTLETTEQTAHPSKPYNEVLAAVHQQLALKLNLPTPSLAESQTFGDSVGTWPAFPDTISALHRLSATYKLIVLSNVDSTSFAASLSGPLSGVPFTAIYTAETIKSYKPDLRNYKYMIEHVKRDWGVEKEKILVTAQSLFHDHEPAHHPEIGLKSVWIKRRGAAMGDREGVQVDGMFETLGEMADAVDKAREERRLEIERGGRA